REVCAAALLVAGALFLGLGCAGEPSGGSENPAHRSDADCVPDGSCDAALLQDSCGNPCGCVPDGNCYSGQDSCGNPCGCVSDGSCSAALGQDNCGNPCGGGDSPRAFWHSCYLCSFVYGYRIACACGTGDWSYNNT